MVGIVDIYGTVERVTIRPGTELEFTGWSARAFGSLLRRFPFIIETFQAKPMTLKDLAEMDRMAVGAVLAAGVRNPETGKSGLEDPAMEEALSDLPMHLQLECGKAIQKCTFPKGLVPFLVEMFQVWGAQPRLTPSSPEEGSTRGNGSDPAAIPDAPSGPDTDTLDTRSPKPPSDSVPINTPTFGTTPPAK